jgi:hypothetical protein
VNLATPNLRPATADLFWREVTNFGFPSPVVLSSMRVDGSWATPAVFPLNRAQYLGGGFVIYVFYSGPKAGTQEYFTYSECVHEFQARTIGNCWTAHTCAKCGARYDVDSSD